MKLVALLNGVRVGVLQADRQGNPRFEYDPQWHADRFAIPLSLSLPLSAETHDSTTVAAVLWGLLPDNEYTLQRWAAKFQVSARNPLALLANVGEDCAGAVQFVQTQRLERWLSGDEDGVQWLDEAQIADRLRRLRNDSGAAREPDDLGQFSLAGAQPKTALLLEGERWGIPHGRIPTSHILKPPSGEFDGYAENEYFSLCLARAIGLPTASSRVLRFDGEPAICVERYDRIADGDSLLRVHQEDFCQALGVHPQRKYQNEGGPSPQDLAQLLREQSSRPRDDVEMLFRALAFNWLISGTDAHAKNYSLLLGAGGDVRLAPLYDLSSSLPYPQLSPRKLKMAMKIGSHYKWWEINAGDWLTLAGELGLEAEYAIPTLVLMARALPDIASTLALQAANDELAHPVIPRLVDGIGAAAKRCLRLLKSTPHAAAWT